MSGSHVKAMLTSPRSVGAVLLGASQPKKLPTLTVYRSPISKRSFWGGKRREEGGGEG